jgi:hypothetical protein
MSERQLTTDSRDYIGKDALGYVLHATIEGSAAQQIGALQQYFDSQFTGSLWLQPLDTLHVTILDYLAPLVDYGTDKDRLYNQHANEYNQATVVALQDIPAQHIHFNRLLISPSAIALVADDAAETFNAIRNNFLSHVELLPNTKMPAAIVHSTIARFIDQIPLADVQTIANKQSVSIETNIDYLRMDRETKVPMLAHTVLKNYPLLHN